MVLLLLFLICKCEAFTQKPGQQKIDSLFSVLKTDEPDTTRVNILIALADEFANNNPDTAIYFAGEAIAAAQKLDYNMGIANALMITGNALTTLGKYDQALKNCTDALALYDQILPVTDGTEKDVVMTKVLKQKAKVFNYIGIIYQRLSNFEEALKNHSASLKIREEIGDKLGIALSYNNIGTIYKLQGSYPEALKNYFASLKIKEETGDKQGIANTYNNIGIIYREQDNYPEALKYYYASLKIKEEIGDKQGIARTYNNIGVINNDQHNFTEALKSYFASLKIREEIGDKQGIALTYNNIGTVYRDMGNYPEALKNYFDCIKIQEEIGNKQGLALSYNNVGIIYLKQKKTTEALKYLNKGLSLAKEIGSLQDINDAYKILAELDSIQGNFKSSLEHYKMFIITRDSMFNKENTKKIVQAKMQYEFDKQRLADSLTNEQVKLQREVAYKENLHKKNTQRNVFLLGGLAVMVLAGGLGIRLKDTRRSKAIIQKEKERSDELLLNILPNEVAEELKQTGTCRAKTFSMVTVMFTDFKDFTNVSEKVSAELLVDEINYCFSAFDHIIQKYRIEKIKTVGDAYMCVSGLPVLNYTHAFDVVSAAIEIRNFMRTRKKEKESKGEIPFEIRIGIHTGPVVAGIVGVKKFQYDIWGDTVNLAARMESSGAAGQVNISGTTYSLVKDKFNCTHRGKIAAKNKGEIDMYFAEEKGR
jgi:adenylate cyclase